jgi:hypothetical protein
LVDNQHSTPCETRVVCSHGMAIKVMPPLQTNNKHFSETSYNLRTYAINLH